VARLVVDPAVGLQCDGGSGAKRLNLQRTLREVTSIAGLTDPNPSPGCIPEVDMLHVLGGEEEDTHATEETKTQFIRDSASDTLQHFRDRLRLCN
jgi:hypothetical protein